MSVKVDLKRLESFILEFESVPAIKNRVLFYGDSYFTRWKPERWGHPRLESVLVGPSGAECALNHGFGSSTAEELLYFYPRAVKPYEPRALVYNTISNDLMWGYSPDEVLALSERLFAYARADFPGIHFYLCAPLGNYISRSDHEREAINDKKSHYSTLLRNYAEQHQDCTYVSAIESPLFFDHQENIGHFDRMRKDIFDEDQLHFNSLGYELFGEFFKKILAEWLI